MRSRSATSSARLDGARRVDGDELHDGVQRVEENVRVNLRPQRRHRLGSATPMRRGEAGRKTRWERLFDAARLARPSGASDLVPFWIYPIDNGACIERHVPALPLSRDLERLSALRRTLAIYRMVFGQPRQDELVEFLLRHVAPDDMREWVERLRIDLAPPQARAYRLAQEDVVVVPADILRVGPVPVASREADRPTM